MLSIFPSYHTYQNQVSLDNKAINKRKIARRSIVTESILFANDSSFDFALKNNVVNTAHKTIIIAKAPNTMTTIV
jgi:hypothetical protein